MIATGLLVVFIAGGLCWKLYLCGVKISRSTVVDAAMAYNEHCKGVTKIDGLFISYGLITVFVVVLVFAFIGRVCSCFLSFCCPCIFGPSPPLQPERDKDSYSEPDELLVIPPEHHPSKRPHHQQEQSYDSSDDEDYSQTEEHHRRHHPKRHHNKRKHKKRHRHNSMPPSRGNHYNYSDYEYDY